MSGPDSCSTAEAHDDSPCHDPSALEEHETVACREHRRVLDGDEPQFDDLPVGLSVTSVVIPDVGP